jgi:hypothetical protein
LETVDGLEKINSLDERITKENENVDRFEKSIVNILQRIETIEKKTVEDIQKERVQSLEQIQELKKEQIKAFNKEQIEILNIEKDLTLEKEKFQILENTVNMEIKEAGEKGIILEKAKVEASKNSKISVLDLEKKQANEQVKIENIKKVQTSVNKKIEDMQQIYVVEKEKIQSLEQALNLENDKMEVLKNEVSKNEEIQILKNIKSDVVKNIMTIENFKVKAFEKVQTLVNEKNEALKQINVIEKEKIQSLEQVLINIMDITEIQNLKIKEFESLIEQKEKMYVKAKEEVQNFDNALKQTNVLEEIEQIKNVKFKVLKRIENIEKAKNKALENIQILKEEKVELIKKIEEPFTKIEQIQNAKIDKAKYSVEQIEKIVVKETQKIQKFEQTLNIEKEKLININKVKVLVLETEKLNNQIVKSYNIKNFKIEKTGEEFIEEENAFIKLINDSLNVGQIIDNNEDFKNFVFNFIETSIKLEYLKFLDEHIHEKISLDNAMDIAKKINLALYEVFPYIKDQSNSDLILNMIFKLVNNFCNDKKI